MKRVAFTAAVLLAADGKMLVTERVARVMRSDRENETAEANR